MNKLLYHKNKYFIYLLNIKLLSIKPVRSHWETRVDDQTLDLPLHAGTVLRVVGTCEDLSTASEQRAGKKEINTFKKDIKNIRKMNEYKCVHKYVSILYTYSTFLL